MVIVDIATVFPNPAVAPIGTQTLQVEASFNGWMSFVDSCVDDSYTNSTSGLSELQPRLRVLSWPMLSFTGFVECTQFLVEVLGIRFIGPIVSRLDTLSHNSNTLNLRFVIE
jgi:hypothetical protein